MFLPTKSHSQEILKTGADKQLEEQGLGHLLPQGTQYKIRIGNRVPKDSVNLAYVNIPAVNSKENVLITDLSNTVLENTKNAQVQDVYMYPDKSLLLYTDDGSYELATADVSMTNIFKDDIPLYFAHRLGYMHYDNNGPDEFGMYEGNGITIVDRKGTPITRPYRVQLIATEYSKLYTVIVFTSFNDTESDTYSVIYNAVNMVGGLTETYSGFSEKLNLTQAFEKVSSLRSLLPMIGEGSTYPAYYQANGANPSYSKFYVPTPPIKDLRQPQFFRYQIGVEIDIHEKKYIFSTPWECSSVLNVLSLTNDEREEYQNGSKQITTDTAEQIMRQYVEDSYMYHIYAKKKYFIICNNDKVKTFTRIDGSSPVYARTDTNTEPVGGNFKVPMKVKRTKDPVLEESILFYRIRPIKGAERTAAFISFVVDGSKSMKKYDPDGNYRQNLVRSVAQSGQEFYEGININGFYYNSGFVPIQEAFGTDVSAFLTSFAKVMKDDDITRPSAALTTAIASFDGIRSTYTQKAKKTIVLLTDGEYVNFNKITEQIDAAKAKDISLCVVTFNRFAELNEICKARSVLCIDAMSTRTSMDLRYFFFELAGIEESVYVTNALGHVVNKQFSMTPNDNDLEIAKIDVVDPDGIGPSIPQFARDNPLRWGLEAIIKDATGLPAITDIADLPTADPQKVSIYIKDFPQNRPLSSFNGTDLISIKALQTADAYRLFARCESYQYHFNHTYAVRFNDTQQIRVLAPREQEKHLSWYPRIKNGRFERLILNNQGQPLIYSYSTPEYYKQNFLADEGVPYIRIINERPKILSDNQIQVLFTPLFIKIDSDHKISNVEVTVNGNPIDVSSWNTFDGIFNLDGTIATNDNVIVSYDYQEDTYVYRGYYDDEAGRFWSLDLNPSAGHYVTIRDRHDSEIKDVPSFALINETIYLYLKPTAIFSPVNFKAIYSIEDQFDGGIFKLPEPALASYEFIVGRINSAGNEVHLLPADQAAPGTECYVPTRVDQVITNISIQNPEDGTYFVRYAYQSTELRSVSDIRSSTIFHTFEKVDDTEAILIGEIHVRPNSNQSSIQLIDTRSRGGGLKPEIADEILKEFEEESRFYWDIGYWDGKPYSENAVVVFRLSRRILKEYGGRFTKAEVEEKLNKHFSYGSLPIIEFIEDSDELMQIPEDLVLEMFDIEDDGKVTVEKPTFQLVLEG